MIKRVDFFLFVLLLQVLPALLPLHPLLLNLHSFDVRLIFLNKIVKAMTDLLNDYSTL